MDSTTLDAWAAKMAARNRRPFDWITPVLLYRNEKAALLGASAQYLDNECIFTAAHGFSVTYPPCMWSVRKLIPPSAERRPIVRAAPLRGEKDDVALCTPASALQLVGDRIPNFYSGLQKGSEFPEDFKFISRLFDTARSTLTGEDVDVVAEVLIAGSVHVMLDYIGREGASGSVFVDESKNTMYILRAYSKTLSDLLRKNHPQSARVIKKGTTFAVRIRYA